MGFPHGAERLGDDNEAIHAWWETDEGEVVAVGRIHKIAEDSDGSQSDHAGPGAAVCPAFTPLTAGDDEMRPAVQIRQMGTLEEWRRQGLASGLVVALEATAVSHWGARRGGYKLGLLLFRCTNQKDGYSLVKSTMSKELVLIIPCGRFSLERIWIE